MTKELRCAVYAAVSSGPQAAQDKVSIDVQLSQGKAVAERAGAVLVAELIVPGQSRSIDLWEDAIHPERGIPAFRALADLLDARAIDVLIFLNWSRLARTESLGAAIRAKCRRAGVQMYDISNPPRQFGVPEYNQGRSIIDSILTINAEAEVNELKRRHETGMKGRTLAGRTPGGIPVWGYVKRWEAREKGPPVEVIEIDPKAAPWVQQIFQWYVDGASGETIAQRLNDAGIRRTRGGAWNNGKVYRLLDRVWRYAGYSEINRLGEREYVIARGNWEPIISETMARQVVDLRKTRELDKGWTEAPYVLSGVVVCGHCGRRMHVQNNPRPGTHRRQMELVCPSNHHNRLRSYRRVLAAVRAWIENMPDEFDVEDEDNTTPIVMEIGRLSQAAQNLVAARQRASDAYIMGLIDLVEFQRKCEELDARILDLQAQIARLSKQLDESMELGTRADRLQEIKERGLYWLQQTGPEANTWMRRHIQVTTDPEDRRRFIVQDIF